jgi:hypothetical protein
MGSGLRPLCFDVKARIPPLLRSCTKNRDRASRVGYISSGIFTKNLVVRCALEPTQIAPWLFCAMVPRVSRPGNL